jgi:hypothetical protein
MSWMGELVIRVTRIRGMLSIKVTAVMTEAAKCIPFPGIPCKLPGKKMVAVGYGEGSGGAEEVGCGFSVDSCAVARVVEMARRRGRMEDILVGRWASILATGYKVRLGVT